MNHFIKMILVTIGILALCVACKKVSIEPTSVPPTIVATPTLYAAPSSTPMPADLPPKKWGKVMLRKEHA